MKECVSHLRFLLDRALGTIYAIKNDRDLITDYDISALATYVKLMPVVIERMEKELINENVSDR